MHHFFETPCMYFDQSVSHADQGRVMVVYVRIYKFILICPLEIVLYLICKRNIYLLDKEYKDIIYCCRNLFYQIH